MTTRAKGKALSTAVLSRQVASLRSEVERYQFASQHGLSHLGARDLYAAGGYPRKLTNTHYLDLYQRGDIAERLVEAYPKATWTPGASIFEDEDPDNITPWEITVNSVFDKLDIWGVFKRADILSRIGEHGYSVILIGDKSKTPLDQEISSSITFESLIYLQPLHERNATILEWDEDVYSERYSYPLIYQVRLGSDKGRKSSTRKVHWSRLIHFTEGGLDNPVYGPPALRSIYNRLMDAEKIFAAGAEAAFKRMDPGAAFSLKEDANLGYTPEEEKEALDEIRGELDKFYNGLERYLMLQNTDVHSLTAPVHNFGSNIDSLYKSIAGSKGFPQRMLTGSEEAQLASAQDRSSYQEQIDSRQALIALPHVRTFVDRVNSDNPAEWDIYWPTRDELNDHEKAELVNTLAQANKAHYEASGELLYTGAEIRDKIGDAPMDEEQLAEIEDRQEDTESDREDSERDDSENQSLTVNRSSRSRCSMKSGRVASLLAAKRKHVENKNQSRGVVIVDPTARSLGRHSQAQSQRSLAPANDRDEQTAVRRIADSARSSFASMMIDLWATTLTEDDIESLRLALDNQDRAIEFVNEKLDEMEGRARTLLRDRYTAIIEKVGKASLRVVERRGSFSARRKVGALKANRDREAKALKLMDFSITNPRAIEWARNRSSALITEIGPSVREVVREVITSGLRDGRAPMVIAKEVGSLVGLRSDQLETLRKFEAGGASEAQVAKRAKQLLKQRGELISRTECMRSSNQGLREMWYQAVDNDLLPSDVKREWIATGDDRTRDEHADLDGEQVGLNEGFSLGFEPGEEPACRCSQGIT